MKYIRQIKRKIGLLLIAIFCFSMVVPAMASEQEGGSITVFYHGVTPQGESIALSGAEFSIYKAGVYGKDGWKPEDSFSGSGISLDGLSSASGQREAAAELYDYAKKQELEGRAQLTDSRGKLRFDGLDSGLYLLAQTKTLPYEDGAFRSAPFLVELPLEGAPQAGYDVTAEPKNEWDKNEQDITIGLRNLTIYTGGNEDGGNLNGFPTPRYVGLPEGAVFYVNGAEWENEEGYPFQVVYTVGEEQPDLSVKDTGVYAPDDTEPGLYIAHIVPKEENAVITALLPEGELADVNFETAILTIRDVLNKESNEQLGIIVSEASAGTGAESLTAQQKEELSEGLAVVTVPEGSKISVNGDDTLGIVGIEDTALLFDDLLYFNVINEETGNIVLQDRAEQTLKEMGRGMENRKYQMKYLDLVQDQDGNLWLSSSEGSDVYWPYPEGTDQNTHFDLFHYRGLHREYGIKGNAEESESVYTAPEERVEIENTEYGIRFHIPESGFSPFVLSWADNGAGTGGNPHHSGDGVKTGDDAPIAILIGILAASAAAILLLLLWKKQNKSKK